jgi:hypothetical protein
MQRIANQESTRCPLLRRRGSCNEFRVYRAPQSSPGRRCPLAHGMACCSENVPDRLNGEQRVILEGEGPHFQFISDD